MCSLRTRCRPAGKYVLEERSAACREVRSSRTRVFAGNLISQFGTLRASVPPNTAAFIFRRTSVHRIDSPQPLSSRLLSPCCSEDPKDGRILLFPPTSLSFFPPINLPFLSMKIFALKQYRRQIERERRNIRLLVHAAVLYLAPGIGLRHNLSVVVTSALFFVLFVCTNLGDR